ncbi:MAG TPA: hypothetical protein PLX89_09540 [Verrucomicrobiota bacterium]|nr:hypothetical protein [Verrucomicrobiales bacterium]HRI13238.1 hypothetical protein [Verrucomicrobiota bacterium]
MPRKPRRSTRRRRSPKVAEPEPEPATNATETTPGAFPAPVRTPVTADRILVVVDRDGPDPRLNEYMEIMASHGHPCVVLQVPGGDPHKARALVRAHPGVADGSVSGIQIFGTQIPSFRLRYFFPESTMDSRGASDLPYGTDFPFFANPFGPAEGFRKPAWSASDLAAALSAPTADYRQSQWVARIFKLDSQYLENLANTVPPQTNNLLIANADPTFDDEELNQRIRDRYRARYGTLVAGQNSRFAFLGPEFGPGQLFDFLEANLTNATFLSIADHGSSNKLVNFPPSQNGIPTLPHLPDVVEFAACSAGDWMEESAPSISVVEAALRNGCLTTVAAQCLLAWNFTRGFADPHPGTNPFDQDNQNPAPMLDIWPSSPSLGRAQMEAVSQALNLLKTSLYRDKPHIVFQVLCGHSLFGDGTVEFSSSRSFA